MDVLSSRLVVRVPDLAASRRFYEEIVGLHVAREYGAGGVVTGVVLFMGNGFLELTGGGAATPPSGVGVWLQVRDVAAEEARLRDAGVTVRKPTERMPWGLLECWLEDPNGLALYLVQVPDDHPLRRRVD